MAVNKERKITSISILKELVGHKLAYMHYYMFAKTRHLNPLILLCLQTTIHFY